MKKKISPNLIDYIFDHSKFFSNVFNVYLYRYKYCRNNLVHNSKFSGNKILTLTKNPFAKKATSKRFWLEHGKNFIYYIMHIWIVHTVR
jgi:hypothetical protein